MTAKTISSDDSSPSEALPERDDSSESSFNFTNECVGCAEDYFCSIQVSFAAAYN